MKRTLRSLVTAVSVLAATGCDVGCSDEVMYSVASPSHAIVAVVFNRNCGATTGSNTQVSLVQPGTKPLGAGNTLILDGTVPLKLSWVSQSKLLITGLGSARTFKREQSLAGVSVDYGK